MTKIKTIFPPQVPSFLPAFDKTAENPKFYFKPSIANTIDQIYGLHVSIRRQDSNETVLKKSEYPFDLVFVDKKGNINNDDGVLNQIRYDAKKKYYYFRMDSKLFEEPDVAYKVQIRVVDIKAVESERNQEMPPLGERSQWMKDNLDNFSEWSIVTIVMPITKPEFGLTGLSESEENDINSSGFNFVGYYEAADLHKKETLSTYQLNLFEYSSYDDKSTWKLYASSGERTIGIYEQVNIQQVFNRDLEQDKKYVVSFTIKTKNLYTKTKFYKIIGAYPIIEMFNTIILEPNEEEGLITVKIQAKQILMDGGDAKVEYVADDPQIGVVPNIKTSHARINGTITTNENFSMNSEEDEWILQTKVKLDKVYDDIHEAYNNPFILMENIPDQDERSNVIMKVKLSCLKINLNGGYHLMDSSGRVSEQGSDWEYRIIARKELVIRENGKDNIVLSQSRVFRTKEVIEPQQEYYIYLNEIQGLMNLDIKKTYKSRK